MENGRAPTPASRRFPATPSPPAGQGGARERAGGALSATGSGRTTTRHAHARARTRRRTSCTTGAKRRTRGVRRPDRRRVLSFAVAASCACTGRGTTGATGTGHSSAARNAAAKSRQKPGMNHPSSASSNATSRSTAHSNPSAAGGVVGQAWQGGVTTVMTTIITVELSPCKEKMQPSLTPLPRPDSLPPNTTGNVQMAFELRDHETLRLHSPAEHVLQVTLNRPESANAMNTQMGLDMLAVFDGLCADPAAFRCVILTGAGEKIFCAGGDLKQRKGMTDAQWQAQHLIFERQVRAMIACPIPIIAAVNGAAYAGGLEMVLCCDFAYAATHARFALTEVTLGIMPGAGGTQNLPRAIGTSRAKEILLTGLPFTAQQAFDWGLVNRICEPSPLLDEAVATAARIGGNAPISTRQIKHSVNTGMQMDLASALMFEIEAYNRMVPTEDRHEGINAFNEKRKAVFKGR